MTVAGSGGPRRLLWRAKRGSSSGCCREGLRVPGPSQSGSYPLLETGKLRQGDVNRHACGDLGHHPGRPKSLTVTMTSPNRASDLFSPSLVKTVLWEGKAQTSLSANFLSSRYFYGLLGRTRIAWTGQEFPQNCPLGLFGPGVLSCPMRNYLRKGAKELCRRKLVSG